MSKTVFITGTSTGFGKLTAITLANAGHSVIAGMRNIQGSNANAAKQLSSIDNIEVVEIDITSDSSVKEAFACSLNKYGKIDVLVNNAAVSGFGLLEGYSIDQIRKIFEVNVYGVLRTIQAVLPAMRHEKSGLIINLTTGASAHTLPFMIPYISSKLVIESITEGLQDELREFNIENVSIQPGVYPTEMNNGSKAGLHADKAEIVAEYGESATAKFNALGTALFGKMQKFNMNPQTIADGILELIEMKKGERPLRFPLDAIAQGTDKEFIQARETIKSKWLAAYTD